MERLLTTEQGYGSFLKYIAPSVATMIFISFYTTIDGFFVSRFVGADALAAINIVIPITCLVFGIAVMLASGSGALVSMRLGEGKRREADGMFSFISAVTLITGIILTVLGLVFLEPILRFLGATDRLLEPAMEYGWITVLMTLPMMAKLHLEYYARVDGSPKTALVMSTAGLILNVVFDFFFVYVCKMGIMGAALGTFVSVAVSAGIGLVHFLKGSSLLKFRKPRVQWRMLGRSCFNGSSEMFTELSTGIITYLFNISILHFYGEEGVASMAIIMYMYYFFISAYFGISVGISPVISFNFGAGNQRKIYESVKYSFITIAWSAVLICGVCLAFGSMVTGWFTPDTAVQSITVNGLRLFWITFLFIGINVFLSGYFTAIGNGLLSAVISICRSLVFVSAAVMVLPRFIGVDGVWLAMPVSELLTLVISIGFYMRENRKKATKKAGDGNRTHVSSLEG